MKRVIFKLITGVIISIPLAFYFYVFVAHAATLQQTVNNASITTQNVVRQGLNVTLDAGGDPDSAVTVTLSGSISSITLREDPVNSSDKYKISLLESNTTCSASATWTTARAMASFEPYSGNLEQDIVYTFASYTFNPTLCYAIQVQHSNSSDFNIDTTSLRGDSGGGWAYGNVYADTDGLISGDEYFVTNGSYTFGDTISITSPADNATSTRSTDLWTVDVTRSSTTINYGVQIRYSSTSTISSTSDGTLGGLVFNATDGANTATNYLFLSSETTYYARAFLQNSDTNAVMASSSVITFSTGISAGGASGSWGTVTSTATSSEWVITCDPDEPLFTRSLCHLALVLFIPKTSDMEQFNSLYNDIKDKPPIGYFGLVTDAINSISTSTTSTFALADLSSMESTFLSPLKAGVSFLLWLIFTFWLFHRFRHFEL